METIRKLLKTLGILLIAAGIIFLLIHSFLVTGNRNESFVRDIFGFPIPEPPLWTSYIPYLGVLLGFVFEYFSIHGLIGITIFVAFLATGGFLIGLKDKKPDIKNEKEKINEILTNRNIPDVIKQEFINRENKKGANK